MADDLERSLGVGGSENWPTGALSVEALNQPQPTDPATAAPIAAGLSNDIAGYKSQYDAAQAARRSRIDESRRIVEAATRAISAARAGNVNMPMLMAGAALMGPTRTGSFGESLGAGLTAAGKSIETGRSEDAKTALEKANLQQMPVTMADNVDASDATHSAQMLTAAQRDKSMIDRNAAAGKAISPLGKIASDEMRGLITHDQAEKAREKLLTAAPQRQTGKLQEYAEWEKTHPGESYEAFTKAMTEASTRPAADMQAYKEWEKKNPGKSYEEFKGAIAQTTASGHEKGTETAKAALGLPAITQSSDILMSTVDKMMDHPGLSSSIGAGSMLPTIPGTPQADFRALKESLTGGVFLQAFNTLRGGGAITEIEGKKAQDALAVLQSTQSPKAFKENLKIFRDNVQRGLENARNKAAGGVQPSAEGKNAPAAPQVAAPPPGGVLAGHTPQGKPVYKMPDGSHQVAQ